MARISRDHSSLGAGVERQIRAVERTFEDEGIAYDTDEALVDNNVSSFNKRASFDGAIAAIRSRQYDVIGVAALDRLSRGLPEVVNELVPAMEQSGAIVMTEDGETFDSRTEFGRAQIYVAATRGNQERARISKRTSDFHADYAEAGRPVGRVPFGYRPARDEEGRKTWEMVPEEAELIRSSVKQLLNGTSMGTILRQWWDGGWKTRAGGDWRLVTLRRFLLLPALAGIRRHHHNRRNAAGKYEPAVDPRSGQPIPPDDVPGIWPAIISLEDHEALVRAFDVRAEPRRADHSSISSTILHCGRCGARMTTGRNKARHRTYQCLRRNSPTSCGSVQVQAGALEEVIGWQVVRLVQGTSSAFPSLDSEREDDLLRQVADVDARINELVTDHYAGDVPREAYKQARAKLDARQAAASAELEELRRTDTRGAYVRELQARGFDMAAWEALSVPDRRHLLTQTIARIDIAPIGRGAWWRDRTRNLEMVNSRVTITWADMVEGGNDDR
ncbi:MAG: recombinase family protein [bacterium]|nr:recombinase family protein [bacterium]